MGQIIEGIVERVAVVNTQNGRRLVVNLENQEAKIWDAPDHRDLSHLKKGDYIRAQFISKSAGHSVLEYRPESGALNPRTAMGPAVRAGETMPAAAPAPSRELANFAADGMEMAEKINAANALFKRVFDNTKRHFPELDTENVRAISATVFIGISR